MLINWKSVSIYVRAGFTDMRKHINGLSALVEEEYPETLFSGALFVFCGKGKRLLKVLYWDRNGFCLWHKRLETDRFPWPGEDSKRRMISRRELMMLLRGIDFWQAHEEKINEKSS